MGAQTATGKSEGACSASPNRRLRVVPEPSLLNIAYDKVRSTCAAMPGRQYGVARELWSILHRLKNGFEGPRVKLLKMIVGNDETLVTDANLQVMKRAISRLKDEGLIGSERKLTPQGYRVKYWAILPGIDEDPRVTHDHRSGVTHDPTQGSQVTLLEQGNNIALEHPPQPPLQGGARGPQGQKQKKDRKHLEETEAFQEAWGIYPHRPGSNPRRPTLKWWLKATEAGYSEVDLIRAVKAYRRERKQKEAQGSDPEYRKFFRSFLSDHGDPGNAPFMTYLTDKQGGEDDPYERFGRFE